MFYFAANVSLFDFKSKLHFAFDERNDIYRVALPLFRNNAFKKKRG